MLDSYIYAHLFISVILYSCLTLRACCTCVHDKKDSFIDSLIQLCGASGGKLEEVERRLQEVVSMLKARHTWLNSGSRLHFGMVYGQHVVMVMDSCVTEHAQLKPFLDVACDVLRDQLTHVKKFTVIRCLVLWCM